MPHFIVPMTDAQLRTLGAEAADRGESIYEAEIRSGLTSDELLHFEAGYFARQFEAQGQGVSDVSPSGDFEIRVLHGSHFSPNKPINANQLCGASL